MRVADLDGLQLLKEQGVLDNIKALRRRYDEEKAKARTTREQQESEQRASEQAMARCSWSLSDHRLSLKTLGHLLPFALFL